MTGSGIQKKRAEDDLKIVRTADHRSHYVIGAIPQWTEDDLRLHLFNEIIDGNDGPYYITSTQVILPRNAVPRILETLKRAIRMENKGQRAEISPMFFETAVSLDKENGEKENKLQKRKVQKIRRK